MSTDLSENLDATSSVESKIAMPPGSTATGSPRLGSNDGVPLPDAATCELLKSWSAERLQLAGAGNAAAMVHYLGRIADERTQPFLREMAVNGALSLVKELSPLPEVAELAANLQQLQNPGNRSAGHDEKCGPGRPTKGTPRKPPSAQACPVREVEIDSILVDPEIQPREELDGGTIAAYAEAMGAGAVFPAVTLFENPVNAERILADGFHRVQAARKADLKTLPAEIHVGTREDARWFAVGANKAHGLRRSNTDKRRAVELALRMRPDFSDRALAEHCGVSNNFVGEVRRQVSSDDTSAAPRIGQDGKLYPRPPVSRGSHTPPATPPAPQIPTQDEAMDAVDSDDADDNVEAGDPAEALLLKVGDQAQVPPDTEIEPAVDQVLRIVADTLVNAVPGTAPSDCLARIAETLRLAYPAFSRRVQHLLSVPAIR